MRIILSLLALLALASPAHAAWQRAESKHFVIHSDGPDKDLRRFAERLEAVHWLMKAATATSDAKPIVKVRVYLVPDVDDVKRLIGRPGSDVAGFYRPTKAGAMAVVPRFTGDGVFTGQVVLFHEYAHHFMLQYNPVAFPAWYVEGFAEIVSTASFERKGAVTFGKAASHRQAEIEQLDWIPLQNLLDGSYRDMPPERLGGLYGQSWLLSHYLTFSDARKGQLRAFIANMNRGVSMAESAKVFGDVAQLQRELRNYAASGIFLYRAPALPADLDISMTVTPVGATEAALIDERIELPRRIRVWDDDDDDDAKDRKKGAKSDKVASEAARTAWLTALAAKVAKLGNDPDGLQLLADAQCGAEQWTACADTADRLLASAPARAGAMLRKGQAMMYGDKPDFAKARDWIVKAKTADPAAPEPLIAYYESFVRDGRAVPDDALDALIKAQATVPQDSGTRLTLASALIAAKLTDDARQILRPLAYAPHRGGDQAAAAKMLEGLEGK